MPEIEFLRRLNQALPDEVPDWFYMWNVKETVAHQALAARPREGRLVLPARPGCLGQGPGGGAHRRAGRLRVRHHRRSGRAAARRPSPGPMPARPTSRPSRCSTPPWTAAAALVVNQYRKAYPAARPQPGPGRPRGLVGRVESTVASSPAAQADRARAQQPLPGGAPAAHPGLAGAGAPPGRARQPLARPAPSRNVPDVAGGDGRHRGRGRGHLQPAASCCWRRSPRCTAQSRAPGRGDRGGQRLDRRDRRGGARALSVRPAGRADRATPAARAGSPAAWRWPWPAARTSIWLMDDDTVPEPGALAALLAARAATPGRPPALVASRVVWTDGRAHPMNTPRGKPFASRAERAAAAAARLRADPFGLVRLDPRRRGRVPAARPAAGRLLPVERRLRVHHPAAARPTPACSARPAWSCTRPATFGSTDIDPGERFFYEVRNKIWMLRSARRSPRPSGSCTPARRCAAGPARSPAHATGARCGRSLVRGVAAGVRTSPRPTEEVLRGEPASGSRWLRAR